jgi:hypothetical protein
VGNPEPIKSIISRIMNELFLRSYDLDNDADFWRVSPNGRCVKELLNDFEQAEREKLRKRICSDVLDQSREDPGTLTD